MNSENAAMRFEPLVRQFTQLIRSGEHPLHERIRELLAEQGISPDRAIIASFSPEGRFLSSGVVVDASRRVYEFEVRYDNKQFRTARLVVWRDVTDTFDRRPFGQAVRTALALNEQNAI